MMKKAVCAVLLAACALLLLAGCGDPEKKVVVRAGSVEITEDNYRYICMKNMQQYFGADKTEQDLTDEERTTLMNAVKEELRRYAVIEILAAREGISLSSVEETQIRAEIQRQKFGFGSEEAYEEELKNRFMTEHVLFLQLCNEELERQLYEKYAAKIGAALTEEQLRADIDAYGYAASQIFWSSKDGEKTLAKLLPGITDAESFYEKQAQYSSDKTLRVCMAGEMVEEFEEAALALEVGQISGVIVSSVGAHIILREALDGERIAEYHDALREKDIVRLFRLELSEEAGKIDVSFEDGKETMILE